MKIDTEKRAENAARRKKMQDRMKELQDSREQLFSLIYKLDKPATELTEKDLEQLQRVSRRKWELFKNEAKLMADEIEFLEGDDLAEKKDDHELAVANLPVIEKRIVDGLLGLGFLPWIGEPVRGSMIPGHWLKHEDHIRAREAIESAYVAMSHIESRLRILRQQYQAKLDELERIKAKLVA